MIEIGKTQKLRISGETDFGLYLTDGEKEVLLPQKYIPFGVNPGDELSVFVYTDSKDRPVATTLKPLAEVGDLVALKVKQITKMGAFLDLGLEKDLLVPFREQRSEMETGCTYVVKVLLDHRSQRMVATTKVDEFLAKSHKGLEEGQAVTVYIWQKTDLGWKAIINQAYQGLIYANEVFENLQIGEEKPAFIKKLREDGKIDLALQQQGYLAACNMSELVMQKIEAAGGTLALGDKSSPEEIKAELNMSKKNFKKILGGLYKAGKVEIFDYKVVSCQWSVSQWSVISKPVIRKTRN